MSAADLGLMTTSSRSGRLCATSRRGGYRPDVRGRMLGGAAALLGRRASSLRSRRSARWSWSRRSSWVCPRRPATRRGWSTSPSREVRSGAGARWPGSPLRCWAARRWGRHLGGALAPVGVAGGPGGRGSVAATLGAPSRPGRAQPTRGARRPTGRPRARGPPARRDRSGTVPLREQMILYFVPFAMFFTFGAMPQTLVPILGADEFDLSVGVIGLVLGIGGACASSAPSSAAWSPTASRGRRRSSRRSCPRPQASRCWRSRGLSGHGSPPWS